MKCMQKNERHRYNSLLVLHNTATKLVLTVTSLKYEERLRMLNVSTFTFIRIRGHMIEM